MDDFESDWKKSQFSLLDVNYPVFNGFVLNEEVYLTLKSSVSGAAERRESGCIVLFGVPGSGKRTLVMQAIREISQLPTSLKLSILEFDGHGDKDVNNLPDEFDTDYPFCILLLTHFEKYCSVSRQSFLYNVIEELERRRSSQNLSLLVIGLTSNCKCFEGLEKRVRSRLTHQFVHLPSLSFNSYKSVAKSMMSPTMCSSEWSESIDKLLDNSTVDKVLLSIFEMSSDLNALRRLFHLPATRLCQQTPYIDASTLIESYKLCSLDTFCHQLESLTSVELIVLISALQHYPENFNFEMVLLKYKSFTAGRKSLIFTRTLLRKV
ncbi:hypothetical protein GJ496_006487 [Pomphorhynchus laevis]|nr:hypothetical protein GJ496_006487 [Pomphorhynchus laevis]